MNEAGATRMLSKKIDVVGWEDSCREGGRIAAASGSSFDFVAEL